MNRMTHFNAFAALMGALLTAPGASAINPCNPCQPKNPCSPPSHGEGAGAASKYSPEIEQLIEEFMSTGEAIAGRPGGQDSVKFPGPGNKPNYFQALMVTQAENPLLEEQCKKEALQLSVDALQIAQGLRSEEAALRAAAEHMREHQDFIKSHEVSYSGYLKEIGECREFCGPLVAHLMKCQVLSVARSSHGIVLFDFDSDAVEPRYGEGVIARVSGELDGNGERNVVLIGRASKIGDLKYNRRLSARRTLAVRDRLLELDVPEERIHTMWFGWEPPQIGAWVAKEYGLEDLYLAKGELLLNQSVMVVLY